MGVPLKELIYDQATAGMKGGRKVKAVIPGGASRRHAHGADEIEDCPLDFDGVAAKGSMLGSAAIIVIDDDTCMVDAAAEPLAVLRARVLRPVHAVPRGDAAGSTRS